MMEESFRNPMLSGRSYVSRGEAIHQRVKEYVVQQVQLRFPGYYHLIEARIDELVHAYSLNEILGLLQKEIVKFEREKMRRTDG